MGGINKDIRDIPKVVVFRQALKLLIRYLNYLFELASVELEVVSDLYTGMYFRSACNSLLKRTLSTNAAPGVASSGGFRAWYAGQLVTNPIRTKALTSGGISFLGDFIAQTSLGDKIDMKRLGCFSFLGLALVGPTLHVWFVPCSHR